MSLIYHSPLSPDQQRAAGIPTPQPMAMADRVRFGELDMLKHVNNVVYMTWFEALRVRYSQAWGISTYDGGTNPRIVVRSSAVRYHREVRMNEDYIVTCRCTGFRNTSYSLAQQVWVGSQLRATFDCVLVLLTRDGTGRYPLPDQLKHHFETVDQAVADG